jgi:serine/threonine-protein kinase
MVEPDPRHARILRAALDLPTAERDDYVTRECGSDDALLARVRTLLALDAETGLPLDRRAEAHAAQLMAAVYDGETRLAAGMRIGPYSLVRELGSGGMGSVWLAERDDGQFQRQVALKLIRLGMDSESMQRRFRRERALLARLQHPNIARLIDGGIDESGRPWFAMEHINGIDLSAWTRHAQPDLRARLGLFAKLCRAVAHAHRQLIVHRDLKPSNVLVQADGEPRLLDFGIARLIEHGDTEQTATMQRFLTRDFAAPEQLRGEAGGTSADVYALGLILFELLTGQRYRKLHAGGDATLRPSGALDATTSARSGIARTQLRGDLDAIVLRALADEPARRYADAQQLADDVQRHLDGKPVGARPDSFAYRSAKFVRRNRAAVVVAALGLVALVAAGGVALHQAIEKTAEAERARIALRQSESVREFIESMFLGADPMHSKGASTTAGELLAAARARASRELANEPAIAADLLAQIGNTYVSLGEDPLARATLREALAFNTKAAAPSLSVEASAGARLAYYDYMDGHADAALAGFDRIMTRLRGASANAGVELQLAKTLQLEANVLFSVGRLDDALAASSEAVEVLRPHADRWSAEYVNALVGHADAAAGAGRGEEALQAAERALAQPLLAGTDAPAAKVAALGAKVRALQTLHRDAEAEPVLSEVIAGQSALYGANTARTRYWLYRRAQLLQALGRLDQAQAAVDALVEHPADDVDQPVARIAVAVTAADIAVARKASDARDRVGAAESLACAADGAARFCEKARALRAAVP